MKFVVFIKCASPAEEIMATLGNRGLVFSVRDSNMRLSYSTANIIVNPSLDIINTLYYSVL